MHFDVRMRSIHKMEREKDWSDWGNSRSVWSTLGSVLVSVINGISSLQKDEIFSSNSFSCWKCCLVSISPSVSLVSHSRAAPAFDEWGDFSVAYLLPSLFPLFDMYVHFDSLSREDSEIVHLWNGKSIKMLLSDSSQQQRKTACNLI